MNVDKLSQWVTLVANVGVFLGFIAVAYQLHLNTIGLEAAAVQKSSELTSNSEMALMGDTGYRAVSKAMTNPKDLSRSELMQVWTYFSLAQTSAMQSYTDYLDGRISEESWLYARTVFVSYINFPVGLIWWEAQKSAFGEDAELNTFFESVEAGMALIPRNATSDWFDEMYESIQAMEPVP